MYAKSFVFAAFLAALGVVGSQARAQYGPMASYGYPAMVGPMGYPAMLPPGGMPGGMMGAPIQPAAYAGSAGPSCTDGACSKCGKSNCCGDCCDGGWCHHINVFGEFLYLRARDAEVAYAVPIDGNITAPPNFPAFQQGGVQVVDPNYQPGFRVGGGFTLDECSMIQFTYAQLDSDANDSLVISGGTGPVARSLVSPLPINAAVDSLDAEAHLSIQFKLADADYKGLIAYCDDYRVAYVVGARYAKLSQDFNALFTTNGFDTVATNVDFEGGGLKVGLEGERFGRNHQWFVYGKGDVSLIGGISRASYFGSNNADETLINTSWKAGRMVTITNLEAGLGWQNCCGNLRLSTGYMFNVWYNITRTNEWINAVQHNNFADPSDNFFGMMSFDGITARVEFLW